MRFDASSSSFVEFVEKLILWVGILFLFFGFFGLLLIIVIPETFGDKVMQFSLTFSNSYMMILGIFLIIYHERIWVRGYPT
jgi:hypothetical protein